MVHRRRVRPVDERRRWTYSASSRAAAVTSDSSASGRTVTRCPPYSADKITPEPRTTRTAPRPLGCSSGAVVRVARGRLNTLAGSDAAIGTIGASLPVRSEEHTSELQSPVHLVCRLLLEKKKKTKIQLPKTTPP